MKKYIISGIALLAIAAVAAWNVSMNSQNSALSDIQLANVEALAQEGTTVTSCLGLWGSCSTASGATSKAPLVEANF